MLGTCADHGVCRKPRKTCLDYVIDLSMKAHFNSAMLQPPQHLNAITIAINGGDEESSIIARPC